VYYQNSKLYWRQRTTIEFDVYEHTLADIMEVESYDIEAKVNLAPLYLVKSALQAAVDLEVQKDLNAERHEAEALETKYVPRDAAYIGEQTVKKLGEYVAARVVLGEKSPGETRFPIDVAPLPCKFERALLSCCCDAFFKKTIYI
jgi:hypothetical protein